MTATYADIVDVNDVFEKDETGPYIFLGENHCKVRWYPI